MKKVVLAIAFCVLFGAVNSVEAKSIAKNPNTKVGYAKQEYKQTIKGKRNNEYNSNEYTFKKKEKIGQGLNKENFFSKKDIGKVNKVSKDVAKRPPRPGCGEVKTFDKGSKDMDKRPPIPVYGKVEKFDKGSRDMKIGKVSKGR